MAYLSLAPAAAGEGGCAVGALFCPLLLGLFSNFRQQLAKPRKLLGTELGPLVLRHHCALRGRRLRVGLEHRNNLSNPREDSGPFHPTAPTHWSRRSDQGLPG